MHLKNDGHVCINIRSFIHLKLECPVLFRIEKLRRAAHTYIVRDEHYDKCRAIGNHNEEQEEEQWVLLTRIEILLIQGICQLATFAFVKKVFAFRWHFNSSQSVRLSLHTKSQKLEPCFPKEQRLGLLTFKPLSDHPEFATSGENRVLN